MLRAVIGTAVGVLLGTLAGVVIGAVGAIWLVPYRGKATTTWTLRVVATATVAIWFPLCAEENGDVRGDKPNLPRASRESRN